MQQFDIIVASNGNQVALTAVSSSVEALILLTEMPWGTWSDGIRLVPYDLAELAFEAIDAASLTTRTMG